MSSSISDYFFFWKTSHRIYFLSAFRMSDQEVQANVWYTMYRPLRSFHLRPNMLKTTFVWDLFTCDFVDLKPHLIENKQWCSGAGKRSHTFLYFLFLINENE